MGINIFEPVPAGGGRGGNYDKYNNQIAVVVNKSGITLLGLSNKYLSTTGFVTTLRGKSEWAMKPSETQTGAYKLTRWGDKNTNRVNNLHVVCQKFIRMENLTINAVYVGRLQDGMLVFSRIPTESF